MLLKILPALSHDKPRLQPGGACALDCPCLPGDPVHGGGTVGCIEVTSFVRICVH